MAKTLEQAEIQRLEEAIELLKVKCMNADAAIRDASCRLSRLIKAAPSWPTTQALMNCNAPLADYERNRDYPAERIKQ